MTNVESYYEDDMDVGYSKEYEAEFIRYAKWFHSTYKPKEYKTGWIDKANEAALEIAYLLEMSPFNELKKRYDTRSMTITRIELCE